MCVEVPYMNWSLKSIIFEVINPEFLLLEDWAYLAQKVEG